MRVRTGSTHQKRIRGAWNQNDTTFSEDNSAFENDCVRKLEYDIAAVVVSIDSPTFSRTTKNLRVTFQGKLASIGKEFY